jgi:hypothetical protein
MPHIQDLSSYIVSFASAAQAAQELMSTLKRPMTIKEYRFKVNISADFHTKEEGDVGLNIWDLTMKDKLFMDYKEELGIEVECTLAPMLTSENFDSST